MYKMNMPAYLRRQEETNFSGEDEIKRNQDFRMVWERMLYWSRMYLISESEDLQDREEVRVRLKKIPQEMTDVFVRYYPVSTAEPITQAFNDFVDDMINLIDFAKEGDVDQADQTEAKIVQDINQIAAVLSQLNPNYVKEDLQRFLTEYVNLTRQEITERLTYEYESEIGVVDKLEAVVLKIADYLSENHVHITVTK